MKYTDQQEKEKIRIAINTFLASKGTTLRALAVQMGVTPISMWQKLNKGNISHEYVNELVKFLDPKMELQKFGKTFLISKV